MRLTCCRNWKIFLRCREGLELITSGDSDTTTGGSNISSNVHKYNIDIVLPNSDNVNTVLARANCRSSGSRNWRYLR